jgi:hypothetical protein
MRQPHGLSPNAFIPTAIKSFPKGGASGFGLDARRPEMLGRMRRIETHHKKSMTAY